MRRVPPIVESLKARASPYVMFDVGGLNCIGDRQKL